MRPLDPTCTRGEFYREFCSTQTFECKIMHYKHPSFLRQKDIVSFIYLKKMQVFKKRARMEKSGGGNTSPGTHTYMHAQDRDHSPAPSRGSPSHARGGESSTPTERSRSRSKSPKPQNVAPRSFSGVDPQSLELARVFMRFHGCLARKCDRRSELSHLYVSTIQSWMPKNMRDDRAQHRPFKQVLYALAHGMRVVRVIDRGHTLIWNDFCNDEGKTIRRFGSRDREDDFARRGERISAPQRYRDTYRRVRSNRRRYHPYNERDRSVSPRPRRYSKYRDTMVRRRSSRERRADVGREYHHRGSRK